MATPETTSEPFGLHNLSPSEGSHGWHVREQTLLVQAAVRCPGASIEESLNREVEHAG